MAKFIVVLALCIAAAAAAEMPAKSEKLATAEGNYYGLGGLGYAYNSAVYPYAYNNLGYTGYPAYTGYGYAAPATVGYSAYAPAATVGYSAYAPAATVGYYGNNYYGLGYRGLGYAGVAGGVAYV